MESRILSREDIEFLLYEWLDVEKLIRRDRFADHSRETFDAMLALSAQIATDHFAPHNAKGDREEVRLEDGRVRLIPEVADALKVFGDAGLIAAAQDYELGGMQLPFVVERAGFAWFLAANASTSGFPFLTMGAANLLLAHGDAKWMRDYVKPMFEGRFFGTMCLSEPHAGSSLAEIRTRAIPQADGSYRLFGNKMWISAGEHEMGENIVHLVLAKLPDAPPGVRGISLFLAPRKLLDPNGRPVERNDVVLAGLNHKMGTRGAPNCLLNFGEGAFRPGGEPGAVCWLVGKPHQGLAAMFHMMNEARIGVGLASTALGYTAYLHALAYARERTQGYLRGARPPDAKPARIMEHADVRRMLLAQKSYAEAALALNLLCARLVDDERTAEDPSERHEAHLLLELLTPIAKSWPSQWCQEGCSHAIQVHGGYGYTRDFPVEQFYRDNRLNPIHEGTHGIHGIDLLGRKVSMHQGKGFSLLLARMRASIAQAEARPELKGFAAELALRIEALERVTGVLVTQDDLELRLANSSAYLEAFGHIVIAWIWLEQMLVANHQTAFHQGKRQAGRYFFSWELPKVDMLLQRLEEFDATALEMADAWF